MEAQGVGQRLRERGREGEEAHWGACETHSGAWAGVEAIKGQSWSPSFYGGGQYQCLSQLSTQQNPAELGEALIEAALTQNEISVKEKWAEDTKSLGDFSFLPFSLSFFQLLPPPLL